MEQGKLLEGVDRCGSGRSSEVLHIFVENQIYLPQ